MTKKPALRVVIVEDNPNMAAAMTEKISFFDELELVGHAPDGVEGVAMIKQENPDLVLMDIQMPHMDGIDATLQVKSFAPHVKVIITTVMDDNEHIFHAIKAGADGYLLKDADPGMLRDAVLEVMEGGAPMSPNVARKALTLLRTGAEPERHSSDRDLLSSRETEILKELSKGSVYTEVAESLFIAPSTVRKHVENIYKKLQVHSKIEAIDLARRKGLF
ncbi:response regulator [Phaeocystidibacter luteus]|nr:response regulator transcription factor [Phaeocystidibacter luteus]